MAVDYDPPGPQAAAFHQDDSFVRGLMGPVGSGKSSACCIEILYRALKQEPGPDGVRRSRWAAVRNTYGELKTTTIKTWADWFDGMQSMKWDTPIVSTIKLPNLGDGTSMELEVLFMALDRPEDADKLRSLELTGAWMNEASELEKRVLDILTQRCGRYPSKKVGGPTWTGVIMDTNPPDDDSWYYKLAEEAEARRAIQVLPSTRGPLQGHGQEGCGLRQVQAESAGGERGRTCRVDFSTTPGRSPARARTTSRYSSAASTAPRCTASPCIPSGMMLVHIAKTAAGADPWSAADPGLRLRPDARLRDRPDERDGAA
jgi:hypothetical protein